MHVTEKCPPSYLVEVKQNLFTLQTPVKQGKSVPLQAWNGPEGSRKLRFPDYMTTAQDVGKVVSPLHWPPLPPQNAHFC